MNKIILGDCLEELPKIPDKSIDIILTDLPYGVTARNKWDKIIPIEPLFKELKRVCNDAIIMTATNPFASELIYRNKDIFKYEWIWQKEKGTGFLNSKIQPLREHELILVFYENQPVYNRQFKVGKPYIKKGGVTESKNYGYCNANNGIVNEGFRYPTTIIRFPRDNANHGVHPTQKPIKLFEYLIRTYTNEGDTVLDCCAGSGTTAIACINTNRKYVCIEKDEGYFKIMQDRINEYVKQEKLLL